jgi:hypothetical protein
LTPGTDGPPHRAGCFELSIDGIAVTRLDEVGRGALRRRFEAQDDGLAVAQL